MNESIELTDEQKETKKQIRIMVKIILYVPFIWILFITISLIIQGFKEGFF